MRRQECAALVMRSGFLLQTLEHDDVLNDGYCRICKSGEMYAPLAICFIKRGIPAFPHWSRPARAELGFMSRQRARGILCSPETMTQVRCPSARKSGGNVTGPSMGAMLTKT